MISSILLLRKAKTMSKAIIQLESAPHKKKSKTASKSNSSKRSDHKHDYEKVILKSFFGQIRGSEN